MRCLGPDKVKEQEAMTGGLSGNFGETRHETSTRIFAFSSGLLRSCALQSWRPQVVGLVAPINHDAILILHVSSSRGYSFLSSSAEVHCWKISVGVTAEASKVSKV